MTVKQYKETWDLDSIFPGGSESPQFAAHLQEVDKVITELSEQISSMKIPNDGSQSNELVSVLSTFQTAAKKVRQAGAFVSCLEAQNTKDIKAKAHRSRVTALSASLQTALSELDEKLTQINETVWENLLSANGLSEIAYILNERRRRATEKLSVKEEKLINSLAIDGYHAWGNLYDTIVSSIRISFESDEGISKEYSAGQAANVFSSGNRNRREKMFSKWQQAWDEKSEFFATALNHLAGFRLQVYKERGWNSVLQEPLDINRMSSQTLDAMWEAITAHKAVFVKYLNRKATLLGQDKLAWYDLGAPIASAESKVTYQEAAEFIIDQFAKFGPEMASFSKKAFEESWIEAEDRDGKRPGGFCTSFPESEQSRIFMTFSGSASNVSTLAHELGHAFHGFAMRDVHPLNRNYAMNVAETASTFAEMIVADAAVKHATDEEERLALLEDKIQRSVAFYMNIHARFLFETRFYEERKQGVVSTERLNDLMVEAQKEAYVDALSEYDPTFWSSKLHFYITGVPFYNFPYTFGYLFSLGIYARALESGAEFEDQYIALLKDTASMTVEDLANKHLGVDLTQREFWESAVKVTVTDVEEFLKLTEK
ncbi:M3 family oligoendopeptidase [Bacillus sp. HMF5848]|uniref:M3 family oligoendopeptidase n=1 Tax=Bacillus sp. HMF5848 TaxID=2495421 RepID=UPI000F76EA6A|nr:M3 family oligoendopeptidase [Bacillus sp. HMF5848]RSK27926.1 M3 family oligoendopeptidase [Bacillus sp. HMF5848]